MKKMLRVMAPILAAVMLAVWLLSGVIYLTGTSAPLLTALMRHFSPPEISLLPESEYAPLGRMTADYLAGRTEVFQHVFEVDDVVYEAFQPHEQAHMDDVQGLFRLCLTVNLCALALMIPCGVYALRDVARRRIMKRSVLVIMGLIVLLALAACLFFNELFILFHRIAFTNELWILHPETDLLIRLMPTGFFMTFAGLIGGAWLVLMGLAALALHQRKDNRHDLH